MRARFSLFFLFAATCFARAESSLQHWTELGRLEGEVVAWEGEGWSDGRTIRLAGVSFPSSKSIFQVIDNPPENRRSLSSALAAAGAVAGSNGGYFHKDFTPLGLTVSRGETIHRFERARLLSGLLVVRHGRIELVRSGKFKSGSDVQQALPGSMTRGALVGPSSRTTERANGLSSLLPRLHWPMPLDSFAQKESSDPSRLPTR